jgi:hypothetical protein
MNFRFNIGKATEAGCLFLERAGGRMNIMKLVKLINGCAPIAVEQIGMALGKTPQQIQRLRQERHVWRASIQPTLDFPMGAAFPRRIAAVHRSPLPQRCCEKVFATVSSGIILAA